MIGFLGIFMCLTLPCLLQCKPCLVRSIYQLFHCCHILQGVSKNMGIPECFKKHGNSRVFQKTWKLQSISENMWITGCFRNHGNYKVFRKHVSYRMFQKTWEFFCTLDILAVPSIVFKYLWFLLTSWSSFSPIFSWNKNKVLLQSKYSRLKKYFKIKTGLTQNFGVIKIFYKMSSWLFFNGFYTIIPTGLTSL